MAEYWKAPKEDRLRLKKVLKKYHPDKVDIPMSLLKTDKAWYVAQIRKVSPVYGVFLNSVYLIIINDSCWDLLSKKQKKAVLDHEVCHITVDMTDKGIKYGLRRHTIEEFIEVVERHGAYLTDIHKLIVANKKHKEKKK